MEPESLPASQPPSEVSCQDSVPAPVSELDEEAALVGAATLIAPASPDPLPDAPVSCPAAVRTTMAAMWFIWRSRAAHLRLALSISQYRRPACGAQTDRLTSTSACSTFPPGGVVLAFAVPAARLPCTCLGLSARGLNSFWRPYPHCTFWGPGNVQSPQLEMYNIRRGGGGQLPVSMKSFKTAMSKQPMLQAKALLRTNELGLGAGHGTYCPVASALASCVQWRLRLCRRLALARRLRLCCRLALAHQEKCTI